MSTELVVCSATRNDVLSGLNEPISGPPDQLETACPIGILAKSIGGSGSGCSIHTVRVSEEARAAPGPMLAAFFQVTGALEVPPGVALFQSQSYFRPSMISPGGPA